MPEQRTDDAPEAGRALGQYRLLVQIGQGYMDAVYKGLQASPKREVAIKVLPDQFARTPQMVARFEHDVGVAEELKHPGIVQVLDHGKEGSTLYVVMEYVEGESLEQVIARGPMPLKAVICFGIQICEALQYAHEKGVIHQELRPANILLERKSGHAKIADFGIATLQKDSIGVLTVTFCDVSPGKLYYMSPEQQLSGQRITHHADVYAFGVILYEMLTGRAPIGYFRMPSLVRSDIPIALDGIVSRCMAESPMDRYQSANEVREDLLRLTGRQRKARRE
jgi:serine/threonine protein kinase